MKLFDNDSPRNNRLRGHVDKYAIYLRKSRADEEAEQSDNEDTLSRHRRILTDLAARKGYYVEKIYEEVISGQTIEARPEIQQLIKDCYEGKYKGIIVIEVTRLSRGSQGDAQIIMDCLKYSNHNNGILVITPTKTYDIAHSAEDEEYMEFELFMSRREYKMINKRMDRGRKQAVVEGNYMGSSRPYGYNIIKGKKLRTLVPNDDEAPIVKMIFDWFVNENMTTGKIAEKLTLMGIPTYHDEKEWSKHTLNNLLVNPVYKGKVRWNNRMAVKTMVNGELVRIRPRRNISDQYMEYDGKHMKYALVNEEMFEKAGKRFTIDRTKSNTKLANPLAGLLFCKKCNTPMRRTTHENSKYNTKERYQHKYTKLCKVKSASIPDVLNAVAYGLKLYIEDFEMQMKDLPSVNKNTIASQIDALNKELLKTQKRLSKLFEAWEDDQISNNEFVDRKAVNNEKIENIKQQIAELEDTIPEKEELETKTILLSDALKALTDESIEAKEKNIYLKQIIDKIDYSRENEKEFILDITLK